MNKGIAARWALAAALAAFAAAGGHALSGQAATPPPTPKNLQVLPRGIARADLFATMKGFTVALGVKCSHCHVETDGKLDPSSDAKQEKQTARMMLRMVHALNADTFKVADMKNAKVTCFTCHRGAVKPLTAPPAAPPVAAS